MPSSIIGSLRVSLGLDSANFEAGTRRARNEASKTAKSIQSSFGGLKSALGGFAAGIGVSGLVALTKSSLEYASSLGEVAQQLGVSAKGLQELRYAGSQVGVTTEQMDTALAKLSKSIGEADNHSKSQVEAFRELGVSVRDASGHLRTADELLPLLADAFARIKDPATRARLEVELFGRAGQKLDTLLTQGSKGVNNLADAAHKLGIVLSDQQIQKADDTADKLSAVQQVLAANIAGVVADNSTAILGLANSFAQLSAQAANFAARNPELMGALVGRLAFGPAGAAIGLVGADLIAGHASDREALAFANSIGENKRGDESLKGFLARMKQRMGAATVAGRQGGIVLDQILGRPTGVAPVGNGPLPTVLDHASGKARQAKKDIDDATNALKEFRDRLFADGLDDFRSVDLSEIQRQLDSTRRQEDEDSGFAAIREQIAAKSAAELDAAEEVARAKHDMEQNSIQQLAGLYQTLFTQGTKGFLDTFKNMGLQVIAQLAAALTISLVSGKGLSGIGSILGSLGGGGGGLLGGIIPGFATGVSFRVGGTGAIDSKLFQMRLSPGEMVDVRKPGNDNGRQAVVQNFDLRGALVDKDVYADMQRMRVQATNDGAALAINTFDRRRRSTMGSGR